MKKYLLIKQIFLFVVSISDILTNVFIDFELTDHDYIATYSCVSTMYHIARSDRMTLKFRITQKKGIGNTMVIERS